MQTLATTLCLIRPNMYMAKLDIKDAYYSIPIHKDDQKLLKFLHKGTLYKFLALPNGYTEGPRKFTKVLKPPMSVLRKKGVNVADYIDDLITMNKSQSRCYDNIAIIIKTLDELGFVIHPDKSVFTPSQEIEYLGFVIDSRDMTVTLTQAKKQTIAILCDEVLKNHQHITIRTLAKLLGKFSSSFIAVPLGKLHYRALERHKTEALKLNSGNFDCFTCIPDEGINDISWWGNNILQSYGPISRNNPTVVITTDASSYGWGAVVGAHATGGHFTSSECSSHINVLELKAALFGIQSLCEQVTNSHILIKIDNTSAIAAINKMGSTKSIPMDEEAHKIWEWAIKRNNWISATHIPGILNIEADKESRECETRTEWMLNKDVFHSITNNLRFCPAVDLFASRVNTQLPSFVSYRPDPQSQAVNTFSLEWGNINFYAFPPFSCIPRVIQKICQDKAKGILVVPDWPTQSWYGQFSEITTKSILIPSRSDLLTLPSNLMHPMKINLRAALVSGEW